MLSRSQAYGEARNEIPAPSATALLKEFIHTMKQIITLTMKYKEHISLAQRRSFIPVNYEQNKAPSISIEIMESNGHFIFSNLPKNTRLKNAGIFIGDRLLSVNGDSVNSTNIHAMKETLKEYEVEISIFGKGITRIRGNDIMMKF